MSAKLRQLAAEYVRGSIGDIKDDSLGTSEFLYGHYKPFDDAIDSEDFVTSDQMLEEFEEHVHGWIEKALEALP